jgi:hypothetical protein
MVVLIALALLVVVVIVNALRGAAPARPRPFALDRG